MSKPEPPKPTLYKNVPSEWFDFSDIYDEAVETAPPGSALIEVGSFWGQSVIYLAEAAKLADKGLRVYSIDTWTMNPTNNPPMFDMLQAKDHVEPRVHSQFHNYPFEAYAHFICESGLSPDPLRVLRMDSLEAAKLFNYVDDIHMVFLDDDHEYEHVKKELELWTVCCPTILAGHDYTEEFDGVRRAVNEYFDQETVDIQGRSWITRV